MLAQSSRLLVAGVALDVFLTGAVPMLALFALGDTAGRIPAAIDAGAGTAASDLLWTSLAVFGLLFLVSMLAAPYHEWLAAVIKVRLTFAMQTRLMEAVSAPVGIAHLEEPAVLDRVALAEGALMSFFPADAPSVLAAVLAKRLSWLVGCAIIGSFRWWLGVVLFLVWQLTRPPLLRTIQRSVAAFGGNSNVMRRADYFNKLATTPSAAKELRIFGLGAWVVDRYRTHWLEGMAEVWRLRAGTTKTYLRMGVFVLAAYILTFAVIANAAFDGELSLRSVAILLPVLFLTVTGGSANFDDLSLEWQLSALPELDALEADLAERTVEPEGRLAPAGMPVEGIRFDRVAFRYPGSSAEVFSGIDLTIPAGRSTAIVGANGAGKTTFVKLLARLHDPVAGRITVDGHPLDQIDGAAWQRKVAVVFQDFTHLPLSAEENIGLGAHEHLADHDGIVAAAERAGARDVIESLPDGWRTPLSRQLTGGADLSSGQWQRLALARALFATQHGASILVLDEPTSMLDVRGEAAFFERFLDITAGLTTVVISHRFSTVRLADQICVLRDGRVAEIGSHAELMAVGGHYARMFRLQSARFVDEPEPAVGPH